MIIFCSGIVQNSLSLLGEKPKQKLTVNLLSDEKQNFLNIALNGKGFVDSIRVRFSLLFDSAICLDENYKGFKFSKNFQTVVSIVDSDEVFLVTKRPGYT